MTRVEQQIIVVGGGAAGIIAAIVAKRQGAQVTILERNPRIGKKILATGNGRCNFTNINTDISCYHGHNPKFAYWALKNFSPRDTISFFEKLGIAHKVEDCGKVFPMSDQAASFLDVFLYELEELKIHVVCDAFVKSIKKKNDVFIVQVENGNIFKGDKIILAPGGKAMPSTGSDGNGYDLVKELGHTLTDIFPGLVQLKLEGSFFKQIEGVKLVGTAEIFQGNESIAQDRGDILFANYGVSGPPILQISRKAGELLQKNKEVTLKISIIDTLTRDALRNLILTRIENAPQKSVALSLVGLINKRLIQVILKEAGIQDLKSPVANLSPKEIDKIADILTDWRFKVRGTKGWSSAQVTAGGINTHEINEKTMESNIIKGLYFAGEIIDIDGYCGGFNLQWAWSSGFVAGENAALS
ncbi:MAG: NAD(P)/FAD-dependent oxidoreductase [Peptococcales bacterium]|jgi:predicted Rossmann fold flavoprotein